MFEQAVKPVKDPREIGSDFLETRGKGIKNKRKETGHFKKNNWITNPLALSERVLPLAENRLTMLFRSSKCQSHWLSKWKRKASDFGEETYLDLYLSVYLSTYLSICLSIYLWREGERGLILRSWLIMEAWRVQNLMG